MKKILAIICLALIAVSCDKIEAPYTIATEKVNVDVTFPALDTSAVYTKVLIEEYTGHRCVNCPEGHEKIHDLMNIYGDTLVPICIHATTLSNPQAAPFEYDFRTEIGAELALLYGISSIPAAIVNRNVGVLGIDQWQGKIAGQVGSKPSHAIQIINKFVNNTLTTYTQTTVLSPYAGTVQLSLLLVEDDIVKPQKSSSGTISDYVHNHVLRASLTSNMGDFISETGDLSFEIGTQYKYGKFISFEGHDWAPENCHVVAILWSDNADGKQVLQVETAPVIKDLQ